MRARHIVRIAVAAGAAALLALGPNAVAGPIGGLPPAQQVNPPRLSAIHDTFKVLLGNAHYLVYRDLTTDVLSARSKDGSLAVLGADPTNAKPSLVGSTLTTLADGAGVQWWDLANHGSGIITLPTDGIYVSAAPGGLLFRRGTTLYRESIGGSISVLAGHVSVGLSPIFTAGPRGVVVIDYRAHHPLHYVPFKGTGAVRTLSPGPNGSLVSDCHVVTATAAACETDAGHEQLLVSLSGRTPTRSALTHHRMHGPAVDPSGLSWTALFHQQSYLYTLPADGGPVERGQHRVTITSMTSAYDTLAAAARVDQVELIKREGTHASRILTAPRTLTTVTAFSLTSGRIAWRDLQTYASGRLWSRDIGSGGLGPRVGVGRVRHGGRGGIATSGALTAYVTALAHGTQSRIHIATPIASATIKSSKSGYIDASGDRVLYYQRVRPGQLAVEVFDLRTQTAQQIGPVVKTALTSLLHSASLWANRVAYGEADGSVWSENLITGESTEVRPPDPGDPGLPQVYAYGDWVGWNVVGGSAGWRNAVTLGTPVTPSQIGGTGYTPAILSLSSNGVVLFASNRTYGLTGPNTVLVQGYDQSSATTVLAGAKAQIEDSVMVWRHDGNLELTTLPHVSDPPVYLGDEIAPTKAASGSSWQAYVPFSAGLTSCSVTFSSGATVVATKACDAQVMTEGDALLKWNGKDTGGTQVTGPITWTLTASNADGTAPTRSGTFTITTH